jgi:hypothetical protein
MTTKTKATTPADTTTDVDEQKAKVAQLQAELKAARLALKEAQPKQTPLEREIARQAGSTTRLDHLLRRMLTRRLSVGQEREVAAADITAIVSSLLAQDD